MQRITTSGATSSASTQAPSDWGTRATLMKLANRIAPIRIVRSETEVRADSYITSRKPRRPSLPRTMAISIAPPEPMPAASVGVNKPT